VGDDSSIYVSFPTTGTFLGDHDVTVSVNGQTSEPQELAVTPGITYNGNLISGSSTATSLVVGLPIALTGSPSGGAWQIPGAIYNSLVKTASGYVTYPANQSSNPVTFFWAGGGSPNGTNQAVTYTVNGFTASATFNLYGPSITASNYVSGSAQYPTVTGSPGSQTLGFQMSLGAAPSLPSNYPGTLFWIQVINSINASLAWPGYQPWTCVKVQNGTVVNTYPVLDAANPYPFQNSVLLLLTMSDAPWIGLPSASPQLATVQDLESFSDYLMWTASGANTIPLAVVNWSWNGTAVFSNGTWTPGNSSWTGFQPSTGSYPTWMTTLAQKTGFSCGTVQAPGN
jgi:hypothetical protein